jgi:hypothetical protein
MNKKINLTMVAFSVISILTLSACSSKKVVKKVEVPNKIELKRPKAYTFNYIPIIGTQTPDDKVIVDMGVVLRVWINSYKDRTGSLVSSHDIYTWAKKPDFIVGNELPMKKRGILSPSGKMPLMLSNQSVDRSDFKSNKNIREFVNSVYEKKTTPEVLDERIDESLKFDEEIKKFVSSNKNEDVNNKGESDEK